MQEKKIRINKENMVKKNKREKESLVQNVV